MRVRRLVLATALAAALVPAVRVAHRRQLAWGTVPGEELVPLPGDGLLAADLVATRAITIDAPPSAVWPWLAQIGQHRGGFYSYDVLENVAGLGIRSATRIVPEWQAHVGDTVNLAEQVALDVVVADEGRALVLLGDAPVDDDGPVPYAFSWAFVLEPRGPEGRSTRLLVRERYAYRAAWAPRMVVPLSWLSFLMTERMMRGLRQRAEGAAAD
jgi:hypothetical protein